MATSTEVTLGIGILVLFVILLISNVYLVVHFQRAGEKSDNMWTKALIICGFQLTSFIVMLVSVDAANNGGNVICDPGYPSSDSNDFCGSIDFELVWKVLFLGVFIFLVFFIPFASFYNDAQDSVDDVSPLKQALCYEAVVVVVVSAVCFPLYFSSDDKFTHIPLREYSVKVGDMTMYDYSGAPGNSVTAYLEAAGAWRDPVKPAETLVKGGEGSFSYAVGFEMYLVSLLSWVGWFVFSIFTGVGLAAVPLDFITAYRFRPRALDRAELAARTVDLQMRANEILETSVQLKKSRQDSSAVTRATNMMSDRVEVNKLTNMMYALEQEVEDLDACKNINKSYNPLIPYVNLAMGILCFIISICWVLQIILYNLVREIPFLNNYLLSFDSWFPMFGVVTYAIFSLYLLFCTLKGCFKLGMRFVCCFQIHTMAIGKTEVGSFLFNLAIVMLCCEPLIQFLVQSFSGYAASSAAYLMFEVQMKNLAFFAPMFQKDVFNYIILAMFGLTCIVLMLAPRDADKYGAAPVKTTRARPTRGQGEKTYELAKV
eukprot:GSChrysophyteH1.ASY1.ANO1.1877.1 assembled CDS